MVSAQPAANEKLMIKPTITLKVSTRKTESENDNHDFVESGFAHTPNIYGDNAREQ